MDLRERASGTPNRHPWELARVRFFLDVLVSARPEGGFRRALDAGSGDAFVAQRLADGFAELERIVCVDIGYGPGSRDQLGIRHAEIELCTEPPPERFDLILGLDVLEHVEEDRPFLRRLVDRHLEPGGMVLLSVPAWNQLSSRHDRRMLHHRRYSRQQFRALVRDAGLQVLRGGGLFHSLLVPRAMHVALDKLGVLPEKPEDDSPLDWSHGAVVTHATSAGLRADNLISELASHLRLPLPGLSEWALCRAR